MMNNLLYEKSKIENKINEILSAESYKFKENEFIKEAIEEIKRLSKNGKRVRGYLIKLGQEIYGIDDDSYLELAAAIEIFQTAILIHDDIIDEAHERRNEKTINYKYKGHYGMSKAICIGDYGFFLAYDIISNLSIEDHVKVNIMKIYSKTLYNTVVGEILDVELPYKNKDFHVSMNEQLIYDIYINKTAWYTIIGPLLIGAFSTGCEKIDVNKITSIGINLGIAFQIKDDLLGLEIEKNSMGKTLNDIKEGKQTIIYKYAIDMAGKEDLRCINKYYGNPDVTFEESKKIIDIFNKTGSIKKSKDLVNEYTSNAIKLIETLDVGNKEKIIEFSNYLLNRKN